MPRLQFLTTSTALLLPLLLLLLSPAHHHHHGVSAEEHDFSDHITCYECEGQLGNSTCSSPGVDIDKRLGQVSCVKGACLKWAFYRHSRLVLVRTCSKRVNLSIYLQSACRYEKNGNGFVCMCANDLCNSAWSIHDGGSGWLAMALLLLLLLLMPSGGVTAVASWSWRLL